MPVYSCPKGHESSEADFCSECGARIQGAPAVAGGPAVPGLGDCPDCRAPRVDDSTNFCEVCGYNFSTRTHGNVPMAAAAAAEAALPAQTTQTPPAPPPPPAPEPPPAPPPAAPSAPPPAPVVEPAPVAEAAPGEEWKLTVTIDPSLREEGSPEAPSGVGPYFFTLAKAVNLIGRRSEARAIVPEVPLDFDDAVSHRHALLTRSEDGSLVLRDIGSSNGTRLNGTDVQPLVDMPLKDGDQITLGHWTRMTVQG